LGRPESRAIDLGCHWGLYTKSIARTYGNVTGVDVSEKAIASAEKGENITYLSMDLNSPESDWSRLAPVDFFFVNAVFEMLADPPRVCRQMAACGAQGARVLAVIPNRKSFNYVTFRIALWIATRLLRKPGGIYNNGITISRLAGSLETAGFMIENKGAIVGAPVYLLSLLPARVQSALLRLDAPLLRFFGGSYHWVMAKKALHAGERA
jgi:2-polyprenyl-3-methyl-5-hydroxy-6-metoxy-1,4-benzoquinol methylase